MKRNYKDNRVNQFRLLKNGLIKKFPDINSCLSSLCGIQSQILSASFLSLFNRVQNIEFSDLQKAFTIDHSIIRIWAYRSTLHIINADDWSLMVSAIKEDNSWFKNKVKKLHQEDECDKISSDILNFSMNQKYFSRSDLRECFDKENKYDFYISSWGGLLIDLSQKGFICHAPINSKINFSHRNNWIPNLKIENFDSIQANTILLRQFIDSYGPIEVSDFAFWRGISKSESLKYFEAISSELNKLEIDNRTYYLKCDDKYLYDNFECNLDSVLLLYRFDPILLSYHDKLNMIDLEHYKKIWRIAGHVEGAIMESGFIIGHWNYKKTKSEILFQFSFFYKVSDSIIDRVLEKGSEVGKFIGKLNYKYQVSFI